MCCKKSPCAFGEWNAIQGQCTYLQVAYRSEAVDVHRCGRFEHISKQPGAEWNPAFGAGCCMPLFNAARASIIRILRDTSTSDHRQVAEILKPNLP